MTPLIHRDRRAILLWLMACALLVAMMVMIGGYTRLSGSGLSITAWKPIHGTIPPLDAQEWREEFAAYQASPQYQKVNRSMTLEEFKIIFWPEYIHRLLGRIIGAVFFVPLIFFAARRSFSARFGWRLAGIFALGGAQGLIGWLMVASGLVDDPQVSAVRLALHLGVAFAILGMMVWAIMDVSSSPRRRESIREWIPAYAGMTIWFTLLCLQIILGALMAGMHAGLVYNTWPTMNGQFLPDGLLADNLTFIQFLHRNIAVLVAVGFLFWWYFNREYVKNAHLGKVCARIAAIIAAQFTLGVLTLLYSAPLKLALAHQAVALMLFVAALGLLHKVMSHGS